jgi:LacI family transcriptional regulator
MKSRTRFIDIAKQAGVGIATVDRVLNERGGVSERTTKIVLDAARELQINRLLPQSNRRRLYVEAIFCRNQSTHYSRLNDALQTVSDIVDFPISVYRTHFDVTETEKLVEHIDSTCEARDGFILFAYNTPYLAQNIRRLAKKTTIVTISTDIPESHRHCYVGIDNHGAGLAAAKISAAICRKGGKVLVLEPSEEAEAQSSRFLAFTQYFKALGKSADLIFFRDTDYIQDPLKAFLGKLRAHNDIRALYGPFNNDFVEQIIKLGKTETVIGDVAKIVHDLSIHSAQNLQDSLIDIVVDSNPAQEVFQATVFIAREHGFETAFTQRPVNFQLYTSENLPLDGFA